MLDRFSSTRPGFLRVLGVTWSLMAMMVLYASCGPSIEPPTCEPVSDLYLPQEAVNTAPMSIKRVEVYCDASVPMQNFVRLSGGHPKTLYSRVLEFIGTNPWLADRISFHRFGEGAPAAISGDQAYGLTEPANSRGFYTEGWTHLGELAKTLSGQFRPGDPTVRIVITDFVQASSSSFEQSPWVYLVNQIRDFQKKGAWQLVAFRSPYGGTHYPESGGPPFPVHQPAPRPFYIMVLAPDEATANLAIRKLLEGEGTEEWRGSAIRFCPRAQMGHLSWLDRRVDGASNDFKVHGDLCDGRYSAFIWDDLKGKQHSHTVHMLLNLQTDNPDECFMRVDSPALTTSMRCFRWAGVRDSAEANADTVSVPQPDMRLRVFEGDTTRQLFERRYWLDCPLTAVREMTDKGDYVFRFQIHASPESLRLPAWVEKWSCDNDNVPANIGRTLNLKRILAAIMRNTNEDEPLLTGAIAVDGK